MLITAVKKCHPLILLLGLLISGIAHGQRARGELLIEARDQQGATLKSAHLLSQKSKSPTSAEQDKDAIVGAFTGDPCVEQ